MRVYTLTGQETQLTHTHTHTAVQNSHTLLASLPLALSEGDSIAHLVITCSFAHLGQAIHGTQQLLVVSNSLPIPLTLVHLLCQHGQLPQGLLQGGVVRMAGGRVLQKVLHEKDVARDPLHGLDEEVVEGQLALAVASMLLWQ